MVKKFVADLQVGQAVESEFLVTEKRLVPFSQPNRAGEFFLKMQLADVTGTIPAVIWDQGQEQGALFAVGDVLLVRGEVTMYRGLQLVVHGLETISPEQVQRQYFQRVSPRGRAEMLTHLQQVLDDVTEPDLRRLLAAFFEDTHFAGGYLTAPAARSIHHNYAGGLLQHSLEVVELCRHFAAGYPGLDLPLLLCGALLHDMGKMEEYDANSLSFEMTTRGKLLGHIAIGKEMLDERVRRIGSFPQHLHLELSHMILSHHGQKDWGSPEIPRTFCAFTLHHADLASARLNQFHLAAENVSTRAGWTDWNRYLEREIYLGEAK